MKKYILAEHLKYKHSFLKKLLILAPFITVASAFLLMPTYFTVNAYNWWYVMLMPAAFALIPSMIHRTEDRKLNYRAVYPLNVNLKEVWFSKVITTVLYMSFMMGIHLLLVTVLQFFIGNQLTPYYRFPTLLLASFILLMMNLWQAPFCLFMAKKFGFLVSVVANAVFGSVVGILFSDSSMWLYCPYSWGIKAMIPVMHILPNGVPLESSNLMMVQASLIIPCIFSIVFFILLAVITATWFSKLEVK